VYWGAVADPEIKGNSKEPHLNNSSCGSLISIPFCEYGWQLYLLSSFMTKLDKEVKTLEKQLCVKVWECTSGKEGNTSSIITLVVILHL
jgi:hypothetical protein